MALFRSSSSSARIKSFCTRRQVQGALLAGGRLFSDWASGIQNFLQKGGKVFVAEFAKVVAESRPKALAFVGDADTALIPDFSNAAAQKAT